MLQIAAARLREKVIEESDRAATANTKSGTSHVVEAVALCQERQAQAIVNEVAARP
jgi:hypothetical protein